MVSKDALSIPVGLALAVLVISTMGTAAGNYIENVDSTNEWSDAVVDAESANYNIENGTLFLQNDGAVTTQEINISDKNNVTFETSSEAGNTTVTVYDGSDTSIGTSELDGEDSYSLDIADSVDAYYVEYSTGSTETGEIDSYSTKEPSEDFVEYIGLLIIGLLGIGILIMYTKLS